MSQHISKSKNILIALTTGLLTGIFLWFYTADPPYGPPGNELSNHSWGILIDIAHKWRSWSFSFWDRGVGGGSCLYSSGFYPIFNPTNAVAFIFNDAQFFKFKVIEPYAFGVFFAVLVLLETFRLRWPYAVFGGLLYMGLGLGRFSSIADAAYFLWGCALFPLVVYALAGLRHRHWASAAALAGCVGAIQFFVEGATQIAQLLIWGLIFLSIYAFIDGQKINLGHKINRWLGVCFIFVFFSVGLAAIQFLPTYMFSFFESVRPYAGQYQINNFPLWAADIDAPKGTVLGNLWKLIIKPGGVSWRVVIALSLLACGLVWAKRVEFRKLLVHERFLLALGIATVLHFIVPTVAGGMAALSPVIEKILKPLSFITFSYSIYIADFCLMLGLVYILDHAERMREEQGKKKTLMMFIMAVFAAIWVILPLLLTFSGFQEMILGMWSATEVFIPSSQKTAAVCMALGLTLISYFYFHPRQKWVKLTAYLALIVTGLLTMLLSFNWNDKGRRTHLEMYHFDTPEVQFFQQARGQYYLPVKSLYPYGNNFNLLYGVHGTTGFLQIPPLRLNRFMASYHNDRMKTGKEWWITKYTIQSPSSEIPNRFPVDFTSVEKDHVLLWPGFEKKVSGQSFDIWSRTVPSQRVHFAHELKLVDFEEMIALFDKPRQNTVYALKTEAAKYHLDTQSIVGAGDKKAFYSDFVSSREDVITFRVFVPLDTFVIVSEIFQTGWEIKISGKPVEIFPADYLFVGFQVPRGEHEVRMRFVPPFFQIGMLISAMSLVLLGLTLYRFSRKRRLAQT